VFRPRQRIRICPQPIGDDELGQVLEHGELPADPTANPLIPGRQLRREHRQFGADLQDDISIVPAPPDLQALLIHIDHLSPDSLSDPLGHAWPHGQHQPEYPA
jgi:hypothetical protein